MAGGIAVNAHEVDELIGTMSFEQVRQLLAHRFPLLMVDKVTGFERGKRLIAVKHVTGNEIWFLGHFPNRAIMPGVLVVEAMAQAMSLLDTLSRQDGQPAVATYLGGVEAQFLRPVVPGDSMEIEAVLLKQIRYGVTGKSAVRVDGQVVARAEITMGNGRRKDC